MQYTYLFLLFSALSIGFSGMGADSMPANTPSTQVYSVLFHSYRYDIKEENLILGPICLSESDQRDFAEIEDFMNDVLKRNELNMRGQFYVLSERFVICPKRSLKIADLNQYKPYTLAFVAQKSLI